MASYGSYLHLHSRPQSSAALLAQAAERRRLAQNEFWMRTAMKELSLAPAPPAAHTPSAAAKLRCICSAALSRLSISRKTGSGSSRALSRRRVWLRLEGITLWC